MQISELISPDRTICNCDIKSKKRALEQVSQILALGHSESFTTTIFEKLLERERLGSTGLGHGVAIPHCRLENLNQILIAFISLENGIDFDANDGNHVDLIFAILVPQECTENHLEVLATAAQMFEDAGFCDLLRSANSHQRLYELIANWKPRSLSA